LAGFILASCGGITPADWLEQTLGVALTIDGFTDDDGDIASGLVAFAFKDLVSSMGSWQGFTDFTSGGWVTEPYGKDEWYGIWANYLNFQPVAPNT